jgi:hypothetical protein
VGGGIVPEIRCSCTLVVFGEFLPGRFWARVFLSVPPLYFLHPEVTLLPQANRDCPCCFVYAVDIHGGLSPVHHLQAIWRDSNSFGSWQYVRKMSREHQTAPRASTWVPPWFRYREKQKTKLPFRKNQAAECYRPSSGVNKTPRHRFNFPLRDPSKAATFSKCRCRDKGGEAAVCQEWRRLLTRYLVFVAGEGDNSTGFCRVKRGHVAPLQIRH